MHIVTSYLKTRIQGTSDKKGKNDAFLGDSRIYFLESGRILRFL
ncbi:hypothetical protein LEP1GSC052_2168 [Leptospira kmetyi serovar Malaysia str. Bejo-Iso9]|nr:hypothetical protein LEP1GSC052_2168 [Leptospira kmetyi serovar Malaysia str. Bejo-Iso9]